MNCAACGMPLDSKDLIGLSIENHTFCVYCVDDKKEVRSCKEIFEGGIRFFVDRRVADRSLAERVTRKNMRMLRYWQDKQDPCLDGELASDEEFETVMLKLAEQSIEAE